MALAFGSLSQPVAWSAEDIIMGQYEGLFTPAKGSPVKADGKVIAEGKGNYRAVLSAIPAEGATPVQLQLRQQLSGLKRLFRSDKKARLAGETKAGKWTGTIKGGEFVAAAKGDNGGKFELNRVEPKSPTEGQKPPAGAIVLLPFEPGRKPPTSLAEWTNKNWKILPDGSIEGVRGDNKTIRTFQDVQLHAEFMCPYEPLGRGQGRGNSGVYLQDFYEVQVLDSFGLPTESHECAAIYSVAAPKVNACFPPLYWQTYDITFRAARFSADGKVEKPAMMTILHNGVKIHDQQVVPRGTERSKPGGEPKVGPVKLQDHGHPVRYRNIWVVELKD